MPTSSAQVTDISGVPRGGVGGGSTQGAQATPLINLLKLLLSP